MSVTTFQVGSNGRGLPRTVRLHALQSEEVGNEIGKKKKKERNVEVCFVLFFFPYFDDIIRRGILSVGFRCVVFMLIFSCLVIYDNHFQKSN